MNTRDKAQAKVDEVTASITKSPIAKGLLEGGLSLIPFLGAAISSVIDHRAFELYERNTKRFSEELQLVLVNINEEKLDKTFIESDEFTSLLLNILSRNARTHEEEKVKLFATLLANAAAVPTSTTTYKEGFVQVLDELGVEHMRVLSYIKDAWGALSDEERTKNWEQFGAAAIGQALQLEEYRVMAYCAQMVRFGLLRDWMLGRYGYKPGYYALTPYGSELANFLTIEAHTSEKE